LKIVADPQLLKRAFANIVTNALQAMPEGGKLTIKASRTEEETSVSFEDSGIGIPEENLPKLFHPLFTTKAKGQGFGLPVCKRIVEAHNGTITVNSQVGKGSTFTIRIPVRGDAGSEDTEKTIRGNVTQNTENFDTQNRGR